MSFISPMLAAAMPKTPLHITPGKYVCEEKYDGHRLIVEVSTSSIKPIGEPANFVSGDDRYRAAATAWSRDGKLRLLPIHVTRTLLDFPDGVYDGELIAPGGKSHNVTELTQSDNLVYVVFDVLELLGVSTMAQTWTERRAYLAEIAKNGKFNDAVRLSTAMPVVDQAQIDTMIGLMLSEGREGLIIKRVAARYSPGKRPKDDWVKMKGLKTAVLTVIGFGASKGTIQNRGPYAVVRLRDDDGIETTVKTIDDAQCRTFEWEAETISFMLREKPHPSLGRRICIEYQEKIGVNYRHPRWDRWAEEGE